MTFPRPVIILNWKIVCGRLEGSTANGRLYYLALAPQLYEPLIEQLGAAGMADESKSWRRIVFEKPFGHDLESAHRLNASIHSVFSESQVFRIDHYLGKETVQNLLVLRFANSIFEPIWNRNYIDHVQITMAETTLVGSRGGYYDQAGILRDMFQNHMFQILSLIAMEPPSRYSASALHNEKVKVLHAIRPPKPEQIEMYSVLGQYQGYHSERGVSADSITPTFAALRLDIDNWRWQGVPFFLRSGKGMPGKTTEAIIQFRCPPHMIFDAPDDPSSSCNQLLITIQPDEGIHITFHTKVPDSGMAMKQSKLYFHYRDSYPINAIPDAYERLLLDALNGDSSLFIREDEIELAWKLIDPVIEGWRNRGDKPYSYNKGTWGPTEADTLIKCAGRNWVNGASFDHD